jgi:large subunit ribosomal protein L21
MYAVIETGGKQYRVAPGDLIQVEKLEGDKGSKIKFDKVLFASKGAADSAQIWLGKPYLNGATVEAEVLAQGRGDKVLIVKMKRRKQYRRTQGHRQELTQLLITSVANGAGEAASLADADKAAKLAKFSSPLKAKGLAHTPKTVGSRKRLSAAVKQTKSAATTKAGAKTTSKKTSKKAE